jgi:hypothetical protein
MVGFLFEWGKGRGDFLNAEVAKVYAENAKKKIPKEYKKYKAYFCN